jgi:hypothetical protein
VQFKVQAICDVFADTGGKLSTESLTSVAIYAHNGCKFAAAGVTAINVNLRKNVTTGVVDTQSTI